MNKIKLIFVFLLLHHLSVNAQTNFTVLPKDSVVVSDTIIDFIWDSLGNDFTYELQIAKDSNFTYLDFSEKTVNTNLQINRLNWNVQYFWRIIAKNSTKTIQSNILRFSTLSVKSLPDINLWLSASEGVKINADNKVEYWDNLVKKNDSAFQSDANRQPLKIEKDTLINNKSSIYFDGAKTFLTNLNSHKFGAMYVLVRWNGTETVFSGFNGIISRYQKPADYMYIFIGFRGYTSIYPGGTLWGSQTNIYINEKQTIDFSPINSYKILYGETDIPASFGDFAIGKAGDIWKGNIAEIIAFSKKPSEENKRKVYDYLYSKYAPPVSLGKNIQIDYGFADTTISTNYSFQHYKWSVGDTTSTIKVNKSGIYAVSATNIFGVTNTDTITVSYPKPLQLKDTTICLYDTICWNTGLKGNYNYLWSDGSTDAELKISKPGSYWLVMEDIDGNKWKSDTINVQINNFPKNVSLGNDTTLCKYNRIYLQKGFANAVNYSWSNGSTENFISLEKAGEHSVTVTDAMGCVGKDTAVFSINGITPKVNFKYKNICLGDYTEFTDLSESDDGANFTSWNWDFGDGKTSEIQNPKHNYEVSGTYEMKLVAKTENCINNKKELLTIYDLPKADFSYSLECTNYPIIFTDKSESANNNKINKWEWKTPENENSIKQNPLFTYSNGGSVPVQLITTTVNNCVDTIKKTLNLKIGPKTDFKYTPTCQNRTTYFTNLTKSQFNLPIISQWKINNKEYQTKNVEHLFDKEGKHVVELTVKQSFNGCVSKKIDTVLVTQNPKADFYTGKICANNTIVFEDKSTYKNQLIKWTYHIDTLGIIEKQNPTIKFDKAGKYKTTYIVQDEKGCRDSIKRTLTAYQLPTPDFSINPIKAPVPADVSFTNKSFFADKYLWNFGNGQTSTDANPKYQYTDIGNYTITLTAFSPNGCADSTKKIFKAIIPKTDLLITNTKASIKDEFVQVETTLQNIGTVDFDKINMFYKINNGQTIKEEYDTPLLSGETVLFKFKTQLRIKKNNTLTYVCASGYPVKQKDDYIENNENCFALKNNFEILSTHPNPADEYFYIEYSIPFKSNVTIKLFDFYGKFLKTLYKANTTKGYNKFKVDVYTLMPGTYVYKINYEGKQQSRQIVVF